MTSRRWSTCMSEKELAPAVLAPVLLDSAKSLRRIQSLLVARRCSWAQGPPSTLWPALGLPPASPRSVAVVEKRSKLSPREEASEPRDGPRWAGADRAPSRWILPMVASGSQQHSTASARRETRRKPGGAMRQASRRSRNCSRRKSLERSRERRVGCSKPSEGRRARERVQRFTTRRTTAQARGGRRRRGGGRQEDDDEDAQES